MYSYPHLPLSLPIDVQITMGEGLAAISMVTLFACVTLLSCVVVESYRQTKTARREAKPQPNDRELKQAA